MRGPAGQAAAHAGTEGCAQLTTSSTAIDRDPPEARDEPSSFAPYAQLVRMLVPSSACIALYEPGGELQWCSEGYVPQEFREVLDALKADADGAAGDGQVREIGGGVTAYSTALAGARGRLLGFAVVQLGTAGEVPKGAALAPSLLRPVFECLAARLDLERPTQPREAKTDDLQLLMSLDEQEWAGAEALHRLLEHGATSLSCVSGALLVPDRKVSIVVDCGATPAAEATRVLDRTKKHLLAWAQLNNRPMVVNRVGAEAGIAPFKILSCPLRDPQDRVTGLMALFRAAESANFEVRDVRILEYMCRKAVGILSSHHDGLTGLMIPQLFERRVRELLKAHDSPDEQPMLYIDIDRLQEINDAFGFDAGDEVIQRLAELIRAKIGAGALVSRLGGDRFAAFLPDHDEARARAAAADLVAAMSALGYERAGEAVQVSISVGLALARSGQRAYEHLLAAAELACRRAQEAGRSRVEVCAQAVSPGSGRDGELIAAASLEQALQNSEFRLQAQAIVDLYNDHGKVLGYEILIRLREASGRLVSAHKFVSAAQRYGLMPAVDRWVVHAAVKTLEARTASIGELPLGIAINVSAQSMASPEFPEFVLHEIEAACLPPELFCFELGESAAFAQLDEAERFIKAVTAAGCHVSLDDFGSGLSSLAHLERLKVSYLKIDGNLVRRVAEDPNAESLIRDLAKAAQALGVLTVAEHVENERVAEKLQELEVDLAQGYYYHHPAPLAEALNAAAPAATPEPATQF